MTLRDDIRRQWIIAQSPQARPADAWLTRWHTRRSHFMMPVALVAAVFVGFSFVYSAAVWRTMS